MTIEEQISRYFDGALNAHEVKSLGEELKSSSENRALYWQLAEVHGLLDQSAAEATGQNFQAILQTGNVIPLPRAASPSLWLKIGTVAALFVAVISLLSNFWTKAPPLVKEVDQSETLVAALISNRDESDPRFLMNGSFSLGPGESAELIFLDGARVAMEGPALAELISPSRMKLVSGRIGVEIPKRAEGFTVETTQGEIIDYGTRFGISIGKVGDVRAEVFEGQIDVAEGGKIHRMEGQASINLSKGELAEVIPSSDSTAYPLPSKWLIYPIQGGFDGRGPLPPGRPEEAGHWSGDHSRQVGPTQGIHPRSGTGMLHFIHSGPKRLLGTKGTASQLWYIVDLASVRQQLGRNPARVRLSGWFNRIAGNSNTDTEFRMKLISSDRPAMPTRRTNFEYSRATTSIITDGNPNTWELADIHLSFASEARYLIVMIASVENIVNNKISPEFDGHFADDIVLTFHAETKASEPH